MNSFDWKWWRFAKGYNSGGMLGDGTGIWMSLFNTKYYWLLHRDRKFCSQCIRTVKAPKDPYERPICDHCNDV